jgi:gliding motility-associated-like protein
MIQACNTNGTCSEQAFNVQVVGDVFVYNAVSPNGDSKNDFFFLDFIDLIPETKSNEVFIYNRWGDEVFSTSDYDNKARVFEGINNGGSRLPAGVYFYKVVLPGQSRTLTGYLELRY